MPSQLRRKKILHRVLGQRDSREHTRSLSCSLNIEWHCGINLLNGKIGARSCSRGTVRQSLWNKSRRGTTAEISASARTRLAAPSFEVALSSKRFVGTFFGWNAFSKRGWWESWNFSGILEVWSRTVAEGKYLAVRLRHIDDAEIRTTQRYWGEAEDLDLVREKRK